jgi:hypothetical protein
MLLALLLVTVALAVLAHGAAPNAPSATLGRDDTTTTAPTGPHGSRVVPETAAGQPTQSTPSGVTTTARLAASTETLRGQGASTSEPFRIVGGLTVFRFQHRGNSNFAVRLLGTEGRHGQGLIDEIGPFEGSLARFLEPGEYRFQITADDVDGSWVASVEQPRQTTGATLPRDVPGSGQMAVGPFRSPGGSVEFRISYGGPTAAPFEVELLDEVGKRLSLLVSKTGPYNDSVTAQVPEGLFWLNVRASDPWGIRIGI